MLLIARAPLQLFQAVQTSILPHLTRLRVSGASERFRQTVAVTIRSIAGFAAVVTCAMLVAGPALMHLAFGGEFHYGRLGLATIAVGVWVSTLRRQRSIKRLSRRGQARQAAVCWIGSAVAFVVFLVLPRFDDRVLQSGTGIGFAGGAALLCALLYRLYRLGDARSSGRSGHHRRNAERRLIYA